MENNDVMGSVLKELKNISGFFSSARKIQKWTLLVLPVFIAGALAFCFYMETRGDRKRDEKSEEWKISWRAVKNHTSKGDLDKALDVAKQLLQKTPDDYYLHLKLGFLYNRLGNSQESEVHFRRAYELFPSEDNKEYLEIAQERLAAAQK